MEINTSLKLIVLEHLDGAIEPMLFSFIPDDYQDYLGPSDKVVELSYWLGVQSAQARSV